MVPAVATVVTAPRAACCGSPCWAWRRTWRSAGQRPGSWWATKKTIGPGGWWKWMATATWRFVKLRIKCPCFLIKKECVHFLGVGSGHVSVGSLWLTCTQSFRR